MEKSIPILFDEKKDCCGCGACLNICPKHAITMKEDECGFLYPVIDENKCIRCGLCKTVCSFQNSTEKNTPLEAYAGITKNQDVLKKSSSGGMFAQIAIYVLSKRGIIYGASLLEDFSVHHIKIETVEDLKFLQGSKYTQSSTLETFKDCLNSLKEGRFVLYSGTPCQIAGLKGFLKKDYENLVTVDIVCHGVPNNKMFKEYMSLMEERQNGKIENFLFRDKEIGWGINGSFLVKNQKKKVWESASSYLYYFTKGEIYRDSCYCCKYTCEHRPGDITLGDYWGVEKQHDAWIKKEDIDLSRGVSAIIANTDKGKEILSMIKPELVYCPSSFEQVAQGNKQLRTPTKCTKRDELLSLYEVGGWKSVDERFKKNIGIHFYSSQIKSMIPKKVKKIIKKYR